MNVKELGEQLHAKRGQLAELLADTANMTADQVGEAQRLNTEITDVAKRYEAAVKAERELAELKQANETAIYEYRTPAAPMQFSSGRKGADAPQVKTLEMLIRESKGLEAIRNNRTSKAAIDIPGHAQFKTLLTLTEIN